MAQKRMFSLSVVDTDQFLEMPLSSRLLYYELGMRADDDGFVANWKKILAFTGLKEDDLKVLIAKKYIIPFDTGVIVIRHWRMNNYLQNDRTKPTIYQDELKKLDVDTNNVYTMYTDCIHSIDKNSIDKNRLVESKEKNSPPTLEEIKNYCLERNNNVDYQKFYDFYSVGNWKDSKGNKIKNWKQKVITWEKHQPTKKTPSWLGKNIELEHETDEEMDKLIKEIEG